MIERWATPDPLAALSVVNSPYNYVRNNPIALIDPTGMSDQSVGADGLTNDQWIQSSSPNARLGTADMFRNINRSNEIADQRKKQGVASAMSQFWTAVDNGATPDYTSNGLVLDYNTLGNEFLFNTNGYGQTGRDTKNHHNFIPYSDFDVSASQGGNDIGLGLTGASLDAMSKTQSTVGIFKQRIAFGYYGNGWGGSQYVNTFKLGKVFDGTSTVLSVYTTGKSYYDIASGNSSVLTYSDATVGTIGLGAKAVSYFSGVEIPFLGEGVAIYGIARTSWDIGNLLRPGITEYEESSKREGCNICLLQH